MSKFTAEPYIEQVLKEVSGDNKVKLLNFINGKSATGSSTVSYTLCLDAAAMANLSAGVHAVTYKFSPTISWSGYFIKTTNYKCFITFKNGIDLWLASVYKNDGTSLIPMEKLTADAIRAYLREDSYTDTAELQNALEEALIADKDILDKIVVEYDENSDVTFFYLPLGIMPLSITLDGWEIYFKPGQAVSSNGNPISGYELDEIVAASDESYIAFVGDLSEQVINGLTYINYSGNGTFPTNTLNIFYPESGGTKLYKHKIVFKDASSSSSLTRYLVSLDNNSYLTQSGMKTLIENRLYFLPNYNQEVYIKIAQSGPSSYSLYISSIEYGVSSSTPNITVSKYTSNWNGFEIVSDEITQL